MKIGELAARTGAAVGTIRFYEKRGILRAPARSLGGQRAYGNADLERLDFVMQCRHAGMKLECIERFLAFEDDPSLGTPWLIERIDEYLEGIERMRSDLERTEAYLKLARRRAAESCGQRLSAALAAGGAGGSSGSADPKGEPELSDVAHDRKD